MLAHPRSSPARPRFHAVAALADELPNPTWRARSRRRGATIVESALVLSVFLMLLFGMFEYCRFLLVLHVTNNAARDGARYAAVQVNCQPTQVATTQAAILTYTTGRMSGLDKNISGYQVAVFAVDPTGLYLIPSVVRPVSLNPPTYPNPFNASDPNAVPWNQAPFPNCVGITIQGTYKPILPTFLFMPSSVPISITAITSGEG